MENSALNKAHQEYRRAEALLRGKRFLDAIECHKNAAEHLQQALKNTENPRSLESMKLQRDFHVRQKDIILAQKDRHEKKIFEKHRILPDAIYQTFEKTDSLLVLLKHGSEQITTTDSKSAIDDNGDQVDGSNGNRVNKHSKEKHVVVEELVTLNEQLHSLVYRLVVQLEQKDQEIADLNERVRQLEKDNNKAKPTSNNSTNGGSTTTHSNGLQVVTDSSGGTSPYVFTPSSELSPVVLQNPRELPVLPPLEFPPFDYSAILSTYNTLPNQLLNESTFLSK